MREITVIAKNDVGSLAVVSEALSSVGINIEAISAYGQDNKAVFRVLTNDVNSAVKALSRLPDIRVTESEILVIQLQNRPGELGKITRKLANNMVNLESVYILGKSNDYTEVAIKPANADFEKAKSVLKLK